MELKAVYSSSRLSKYNCIVSKAKIFTPNSRIASVLGDHSEGKDNSNAVEVSFVDSTVLHFPIGIRNIFQNIKKLALTKCGMTEICAKSLAGLENLESLDLSGNNLTMLPSNLFRGMRELRSISFRNNKLMYLSPKLLEWEFADKLKLVDFRGNASIDTWYSEGITRINLRQLRPKIALKCQPPSLTRVTGTSPPNAKFEELWETGRFWDFRVEVETEAESGEFVAHKCLLGMESPVLAKMFQSLPDFNRLKLENFSVAAVDDFLRFMYTHELRDASNVLEVFTLAVKYGVDELREVAEQNIIEMVDQTNAMRILNFGYLHASDDIIFYASNEVKKVESQRIKIPINWMTKPDIVRKHCGKSQLAEPKRKEEQNKCAERDFIIFD